LVSVDDFSIGDPHESRCREWSVDDLPLCPDVLVQAYASAEDGRRHGQVFVVCEDVLLDVF
jgi:hypothetical protein